MKRLFFTAAIFFVLSGAVWGQLQAVSIRPQGNLDEYAADIAPSVTFNKPVVALGAQSQIDSAACPLEITPAIKGDCRWLGTQTLTFTPSAKLPSATAFTVKVRAGLKAAASADALANDIVWTFSTPRPQVFQSIPYDGEKWIGPSPKIMAAFNMPPDMAQIAAYTELVNSGVRVPVKISKITPELFEKYFKYSDIPAKNIIVIDPSSPLKKNAAYKLIFNKGLLSESGPLGMQKDYILNFQTYGDLALAQAPKNDCLPNTPSLMFTNPVQAGEIYKNISFSPALDFKSCDESNSGYQEEAVVNGKKVSVYQMPLCGLYFKAGQTYKVKINGALKDVFGQSLGRDISFDWGNDGYCPSVDFKGGFGVIESYLKPYHPAAAVNAGQVKVEKQFIDYASFIPFFKNTQNWCDKKELSGSFITKIWQPNIKKDEGVNSFIDLSPALAPFNAGIVFAQFLKPSAKNEVCWQNSFDNVTNMGLSIKISPKNILVWATYLQDGKPAKHKEVELRSADNKILWQGKTDGDGLALAPGWADLKDIVQESWGAPEVWAFVKDGENIALISSSFNDGIQPWRFNISYDYSPKAQPLKAFIFTERGIYRTGEDVRIKTILRSMQKSGISYSSAKQISLIITDPRGQEVANKTLPVSGSAADYVYSLPPSAPTGTYNIRVEADGQTFNQDFRAEAVKAAEFNVQLSALSKRYFAGGKADFALSAQYMFGGVLDGAQTKWDIKLAPLYFSPKGWEGYSFTDYNMYSNLTETQLLSQTSKLNDKGSGSLSVKLPALNYAVSVYAQAGVLSPQNQQLFARASSEVLPADIFIGIKTPSNIAEEGKPYSLQIVCTDAQGNLVPSTDIEAVLERRDYLSVRKTGVSGRLEWISNDRIETISRFSFLNDTGKTDWSFTPNKAGSYALVLKAKDKQGRVNTSSASFYVSAQGEAYWQQQDDDILQLVADKAQYAPGDSAKVLIKSPFKTAYALVTVEREGILYSDVVKIKGGAQYVKIPIENNYAPNVFVSIVLTQGRSALAAYGAKGEDLGKPQAKFGYIALDIAPAQFKLLPFISTDKQNYEPGQTVNLTVNVKNYKGKNNAAALTVYAVDEGVLALSDYKTPDIFSYFYEPVPLAVTTADNRLFLIGQRSFGQKGENRGGGGANSKLGGIDLRNNFKFVPFYSATVNTDRKGQAKLSFTLPDNLTKFRIIAVAADKDKFGSAQSFIEVAKPLMIKPLLPRFARIHDTFDCGAVVYNYTKEDNLKTLVNIKTEGDFTFKGAQQREVNIGAGKSVTVKGRCTVKKAGQAVFSFTAQNTQGSDGLKVNLPLLGFSAPQNFATSNIVQGTAAEVIQKPSDILADQPASLQITLGSSAALNIKTATDFLDNYAYYCLEQRLSKLTPYVFGGDILQAFGAKPEDIKKTAQDSIDKIAGYQTPSGAFAYWQGSRYADAYLTAYTLDVLFTAQKQGYKTDKEAADKAVLWLNSYLSSQQESVYKYTAQEDYLAKAYGVYALALYGNNNAGAYFNNLYAARASLGLEGKIYLLKAAHALKLTAQSADLKRDILNYAAQTPQTLHFESAAQKWIYSSNAKVTALALEALLEQGGFADDYKAAAWLNTALGAKGGLGVTADNAAAFRALSAYIKVKEAQPADFTAEVKLNGAAFASAVFKGRTEELQTFKEDLNSLFKNKDSAKAQFVKNGQGTLYYKTALSYYAWPSAAAQNAGFTVSKTINAPTPLKTGQTAEVSLTVTTGQERTFVILEDFLPAGFEVIDTTLATEGDKEAEEDAEEEGEAFSINNPFERVENYDDRVVAFADFMPKGTYTFKYKVRAIAAGSYVVPFAAASQMYAPEVFGKSAALNTLQIQ